MANNPLRIMLVTHYYPQHRGGIELVAAALAKGMASRTTIDIEWFASDCDPLPTDAVITARPMPTWNRIESLTGLPYPLWSPRAWPELWRAVRRSDLVHLHDYIYMGNLLAWLMASLARRPCVITQHVGNIPLSNPVLRFLLRSTNATLGSFVLKHTSATVFVSDIVRRQFFRCSGEEVKTIANGVDTAIFRPLSTTARTTLRTKLGFSEERPLLLFVGRFVAKKGMPLLRELVARLPEVQWVFAGQGPLDPGTWNESAVRVFHDRSGPTLAELYQIADLLVLPSVGEGFPLVVQEAMACGTPVLAGGELVGALPDVDHVLMTEDVREPYAVDRWQARLVDLIRDLDGLAQRRETVAQFASEHWSWDRCAGAYLDLYLKATNR